MLIATKSPTWELKEPEDFDKFLDQQLERLQTDCIEFYMQHGINAKDFEKFKEMGIFQRAQEAKKAGKIRYFGFSFHDKHEAFINILNEYPWDFCMIQYNYLDVNEQAGKAGLEAATAKGVPVIVMEPLRGGRIAANLPAEIATIFEEAPIQQPPVEWAMRWLADQPGVVTILSGMSTMEQVEQNVAICAKPEMVPGCCSAAEHAIIAKVTEAWRGRIKVDCTECRYCVPCPQEIPIPDIFTGYNYAAMFDAWDFVKRRYTRLVEEKKDPGQCNACGACEAICPQQLKIIDALKEAAEAISAKLDK